MEQPAEQAHRRTRGTHQHDAAQESLQDKDDSKGDHHRAQFLLGLNIAGVASALLTTVFGLFHIDVFLRVYELPLATYATGNFIFSIINTANDVAGAWIIDMFATRTSRSSFIGVAGCIFAVCFLTPFFRWETEQGVWDGVHFVTSMSLYDSLFSFTTILIGSVVTDDHTMSDQARVRFMASGKFVNLIASFIVARIGLALFSDGEDMRTFRIFVLVLSVLVCMLFVLSHWMMASGMIISWKTFSWQRKRPAKATFEDMSKRAKRKLRFQQVVRDLWPHDNFRAWIGMEMLLEGQQTFVSSFLKTFVDRLVEDAGVSHEACDLFLSLLSPLKQIACILCYLPIRGMGYQKVYTWMFRANLVLSLICLTFASPAHPYLVALFLLAHTVMTGAVQSAGFHLAMSDMVLEMKRGHVLEGRMDEPSLAGLFMGANALLCKPMESVLPIVAAFFLGRTDFSTNEQSEDARWVLFYLMVVPPLLFSCLQLLSWSRYNLHPERTDQMRQELKNLVGESLGV